MSIKLFDYQQNDVNRIFEKHKTVRKLLYQLSTGGGKTFIFSEVTRRFLEENKNKRVLILCNKDELIGQTIKSLAKIGVTSEAVYDKTKKLKHTSQVYVAMVETANNRLKKNPYFFLDVGIVIADECHIQVFEKVFNYFKECLILGCTATPVLERNVSFYKCNYCKSEEDFPTVCCGLDMREWIKQMTMSMLYEDIVVGISIGELIDKGRLVRELTIAKDYADSDVLELGDDNEFTSESMDEAYNSAEAIFNCYAHYKEFAEGKKTMIFNGTTNTNLIIYERFVNEGVNVKMYDSVNSNKSDRKSIVEWFENTPDAVLMNVGCFTTGFDVTDVECIIMNRPTNSLSLFLQIVGRGGRVTDKIFKDKFIFIDGGGNVKRFNEWSDDSRDWEKIFYEGIRPPREKRPKSDIMDVQACMNCGELFAKSASVCPACGEEIRPPKARKVKESEEIMKPIREIPPPNEKNIYNYTVRMEENINFAFKILIGQVVDMFRFYRVSKESYIFSISNGKFKKSVEKMIDPVYYYLIAQDGIEAHTRKKKEYVYKRTIDALDKFYNINNKKDD